MLTTGIFLGFFSWLSMYMSWRNFPRNIKRLTLEHPIIAEAIASISIWLFITAVTKTLIGVIAATVTGLLINLTFELYKRNQWLAESQNR